MKHKTSKRSSSNKQQQQQNTSPQNQTRRLSNSSTGAIDTRTKSSKKTNLCTDNTCFDSKTSFCKANLLSKSQKLLKRDLLRCSDQQPSLLGSHTLQTPRIRHESQQVHPSTSSSLSLGQVRHRRRSLSADAYLTRTTNDRIGPWPDMPTVRTASAGNELLNPIKTCRTIKNPRMFSPKYYASLTENTGKFKFHTSTEMYMNEYRKQKGYLLGAHRAAKVLPRVLPTQTADDDDDDQLSTTDTINDKASGSDGENERQNDATTERTLMSTNDQLTASITDLSSRQNVLMKSTNSFGDHPNIPPSIPSLTKNTNETHHMTNFSTIAFRNGHLRTIRHPPHHHHHNQQHQTVVLPPLNSPSLQYLNGLQSIDKFYSNNTRKPLIQNHQKFFLIEGRNKKSYVNKNKNPPRIHSDSEATSRAQDYSDLQATGGPVLRTTQRTTALVVYQLPRQPPTIVTSQNDLR